MRHILIFILFSMGFTGCASHHVVPDLDYVAHAQQKAHFVVAFDQDGHVYPACPDDELILQPGFDWVAAEREVYKPLTGNAFKLKGVARDGSPGAYYNAEVQEKITARIAAELSGALEGREKLFIYIHGFNNGYEKSREGMQAMIDATAPEDSVVLRVIWDGLQSRPVIPVSIWGKALTYSNLAGQVGLRRVLQKLERPVDITFVTHSRGAAVAMSTVFTPLYDRHIVGDSSEPLTREHVKSIDMLMLAPAIGDGHLADGVISTRDEEVPVRMFVVANKKDKATCKSIFGSRRRGDTSLGCGKREGYIRAVKSDLNERKNMKFEYAIFSEKQDGHGIGTYLAAPETTRFIRKIRYGDKCVSN